MEFVILGHFMYTLKLIVQIFNITFVAAIIWYVYCDETYKILYDYRTAEDW